MPRDDEDDWDEPHDDGDDETDVVACPNCGADVYAESDRCPSCGDYVTHGSSHALSGKPGWYVILALAGIVAVIAALIPW